VLEGLTRLTSLPRRQADHPAICAVARMGAWPGIGRQLSAWHPEQVSAAAAEGGGR
jgi:hypothetical protein